MTAARSAGRPRDPAGSTLAYGVLGPVEARRGSAPVQLGGAKPRAILAMLLLRPGHVVTLDELVEGLWGPKSPPSAQKMVQTYVSRLRALLDDSAPAALVTQGQGYTLRVAAEQSDLERFQGLTAEARARVRHDPAAAAELLRQALALFRGAPLSNVADEPFALPAIARLNELRLLALEDRIDAELASGRHRECVSDLRDLIAQHPLRERFRGQLMLALYRSDRQAEALDVYRETRDVLRDELGISPSPELERLQVAILRHAGDLSLPDSPAPSPSASPTASDQRPAVPTAPTRRRPRAFIPILAAALALAVVVTALVLRQTDQAPVVANSVAELDPGSGAIVADVPVGAAPGPLSAASGNVWVGNLEDRTVTRIDASSKEAVKTFGLAAAPVSVTATPEVVWIGDGYAGTLSRILTRYDQLTEPFFPGSSGAGFVAVAATPDDLWAGTVDGSLFRLDPSSLTLKADIHLPRRARAIALLDGVVWTIQYSDSTVRRVDPGTNLVTAPVQLPQTPLEIATGFGAVWVATSGDDRLWRIDPSHSNPTWSAPLGLEPAALALGAGSIWVADGSDGTIDRIDPATGALERTYRLGRPVGGLVVAADDVWASVH